MTKTFWRDIAEKTKNIEENLASIRDNMKEESHIDNVNNERKESEKNKDEEVQR